MRLFWAFLGALVTLSIGVLTYHPTEYKETVKTVIQTDTITNIVTVRDTIYKPKPVTTEIVRVDTVRADTVLVYESKKYNVPVRTDSVNGEIDVVASGVDVAVDSVMWRFEIPTRTITNTIETERIVTKKTHLNWGVFVGPSYNVINKSVDVSVGFGLMFSL